MVFRKINNSFSSEDHVPGHNDITPNQGLAKTDKMKEHRPRKRILQVGGGVKETNLHLPQQEVHP